ncbi:MAG: sigma-70 family RNA polymerase sigma factor [Acidobacteria bacterium]|nr:sigma-70 family RNA polymerase sigma factor [Acidobacteriota bacterium]
MSLETHPQEQSSDAQLIRQALRGDQQALETLFARDNHALYQVALRLLGNPEDAEDALQEGLLSAYRNLRRFEGRAQFSTWLTRIVINAALMRRRSQRIRQGVSLDEPPREGELPLAEKFADSGPSPEQVYAGKQLNQMVEEDLAGLSPLLRSAFLLREIEGLSTGEAAEKLGVNENTLKARLWRARQELADRLGRRLRREPGDTVESESDSPSGDAYRLGGMPYAFGTD